MRSFLKKVIKLIPEARKKQVPFFLSISLLNTILDFISIALLVPYILLLLDSEKSIAFIYDNFSLKLTKSHIVWGLGLLVLFYIIKNFIQTRIIFRQSKFIYNIASDISKRLMHNYLFGNYALQVKQDKGSLLRDFQKLPVAYGTFILLPLYTIISELLILTILVGISFYLNPKVTIVAITFISIGTLIILKFRTKKITFLNKTIAETYKESLNQLMNVFSGFLQIKSSKSEQEFENKFNEANENYNTHISQLTAYKQSNVRFFEILLIIGISLLLLYTQITGLVFLDIILLSFLASSTIKLIPSFNKIITSILDIRANQHAVNILSEYELNTHNQNFNISFSEIIELQNISFEYNKKLPILKNINLKISKGDFIVISGKSGIGKTTLLHVLTGLLTPTNGSILIDQKKIIATNSFLPFVSIVPQQPFLFKGTLLENIVMKNDANINEEYILKLINIFHLSNWFKTLPNGLRTELDIDSKTISGGQKQRISLIRALYSKPQVLLLDEATNQLDEKLEIEVLNYLKEICDNDEITIIAVSHNKILLNYTNINFDIEKNKVITN